MQKLLLIGVGVLSVGTAAWMWGGTRHWYETVPGVSGTGPLNLQFAKDVALAYFSSGVALIWAGVNSDRSAALCGAFWLVLHALFHVWIWVHRGLPADVIALTNLAGIQLPAWGALILAFRLNTKGVTA